MCLGASPARAQVEPDLANQIAAADTAFDERDRDADGVWAQAEPIATAIAGYRKALEQQPDNVVVRTKATAPRSSSRVNTT